MNLQGYALRSRTNIELNRPERYATQLKSHLGHKAKTHEDFVIFDFGVGQITTTDTSVQLEAFADTDKMLEKTQNVLSIHLLRFAKANNLSVWWTRIDTSQEEE